ncbi:protein FAR1-RELATED SEQUENCE 5-like [Helianthus annuus]|uniref:protein FAR1-RELATED SEQUENCE 5-like n=1 Tax=Helianthus annuus TaxID=4232 RepID=UPI000B9064A9|nr:protein FAR1-RELATED SEQUENCE 5-like [Helianthus annuus]
MYNQRKYWAKAFLKDCFFAGMTSSGRSESIHSFFYGYINSKTMLNEFVIQYDKVVEARRAAEEDEDFKTMNSKPVLSSVNLIEAKASSCYTRKLFDVFKKEWVEATFNLTHDTISKTSEQIIYKVGQVDIDKIYWRNVNFRVSDKIDVTCSCAKFETYGILCKHILYVLKKRHVETLPDHYILPRWTLDARKAIEQARDSPVEIKKLNILLLKFLEEQSIRTRSKQLETASQDSMAGRSQMEESLLEREG